MIGPEEFPLFSQRFEFHSGENELYFLVKQYKEKEENWIDLTLSNPTKARLVYPSEAILHSLSKPGGIEYDPNPKGILSARETVSLYYRERGLDLLAEDLFLVSSSSEAYSYLIKLLCDPGDQLLIPSPGYPLFEFVSMMDSVDFDSYQLEEGSDWKINFSDLESKITSKTKIVFVVSPNNPTGNILSPEEFEKLKALAKKKKFAIVIDEVFIDYVEDPSLPRIDPSHSDVPIFTVNGISKILALPQMKLSWIHVSGQADWKSECKERLEIIADTYLSVGTPIQLALPELFQWRKMIQGQVQRRIQRNLQIIESQINGMRETEVAGVPGSQKDLPKIRIQNPQGGWYSILRSDLWKEEEEFCLQLLKEEKVLIHSGPMFGFTEGSGFLVLSLILENDVLEEGLNRLIRFANRYK
ncbi:pyridoxal phosphate-dependent aminotransferase [Leptospira langatensis]|uniref:Pyridoxal phosphate-dependent aminotransferase n=1 Tax=Leptospira langatensis TaxID=2484983 RepID=A0A5F1ZWU1_9LEPT|nr:pyridoxal phosphate-dependent aminotransferase [Leptospira langatensis]TGK01515.1 pyridoxal phosphate-dependent aminotransferase [Leptospira langatensis]TGL42035.1 pyridoxal phosphate-dependent aminotransferase [Leptospira langatensis]